MSFTLPLTFCPLLLHYTIPPPPHVAVSCCYRKGLFTNNVRHWFLYLYFFQLLFLTVSSHELSNYHHIGWTLELSHCLIPVHHNRLITGSCWFLWWLRWSRRRFSFSFLMSISTVQKKKFYSMTSQHNFHLKLVHLPIFLNSDFKLISVFWKFSIYIYIVCKKKLNLNFVMKSSTNCSKSSIFLFSSLCLSTKKSTYYYELIHTSEIALTI